jgi:hypothetical protein
LNSGNWFSQVPQKIETVLGDVNSNLEAIDINIADGWNNFHFCAVPGLEREASTRKQGKLKGSDDSSRGLGGLKTYPVQRGSWTHEAAKGGTLKLFPIWQKR